MSKPILRNLNSSSKPAEVGRGEWLKRNATPLLTLFLVIAIVAGFLYYGRQPERIAELKNYGYLGAFLISLIGNGSVLLPVMVLPILCAIGVFLFPATGIIGPVIVGLVGGAGAGVGEMTGYMLGYSGRGVIGYRRCGRGKRYGWQGGVTDRAIAKPPRRLIAACRQQQYGQKIN